MVYIYEKQVNKNSDGTPSSAIISGTLAGNKEVKHPHHHLQHHNCHNFSSFVIIISANDDDAIACNDNHHH